MLPKQKTNKRIFLEARLAQPEKPKGRQQQQEQSPEGRESHLSGYKALGLQVAGGGMGRPFLPPCCGPYLCFFLFFSCSAGTAAPQRAAPPRLHLPLPKRFTRSRVPVPLTSQRRAPESGFLVQMMHFLANLPKPPRGGACPPRPAGPRPLVVWRSRSAPAPPHAAEQMINKVHHSV